MIPFFEAIKIYFFSFVAIVLPNQHFVGTFRLYGLNQLSISLSFYRFFFVLNLSSRRRSHAKKIFAEPSVLYAIIIFDFFFLSFHLLNTPF